MRAWRRLLVLLGVFSLGLLGSSAEAFAPHAGVLTVKGAITPVVAGYLARGLDEAPRRGQAAVVIELDTPGGLDSAMRDIVQHMEASRVPVLVYVAPPGARAASAGTFLVMAAQVAAMAPDTAIGAASPVGSGGADIQGTEKTKVTNDAAAYIRTLARSHGRNAAWAEQAVRRAVSLNAEEAVRAHVVDLVASDLPSLLDRVDGRVVTVAGRSITLRTRRAVLEPVGMAPFESLMEHVVDPNVALVLLNLGMLGLFFELANPGLIVPGVVGGLCLLLAFFSLGMLPVNIAGIALIAFAFLLFVTELFVPTYGALAIGGIVSLVLGALMLVNPGTPGLEVSRPLIGGIALVAGLLVALLVTLAYRAQRRKVTTGSAGMVGAVAEVRVALEPEGQVFVRGELWRAVSLAGPVPVGARVTIARIERLTLYVVPVTPPLAAGGSLV